MTAQALTAMQVGEADKLSKKLKTLGKKAAGRAANVSIEGRDVTVRH